MTLNDKKEKEIKEKPNDNEKDSSKNNKNSEYYEGNYNFDVGI